MEWTLIPIRLGMKRKMFSSVWSAGVAGLRSVGCLGRPLLWLIFASAAIVVLEVFGLRGFPWCWEGAVLRFCACPV